MPRPCSVCTSDHRHEVDQALAAGVSVRAIARRHGLSERALARHRDAHLRDEVHQARPPDTADGPRPPDTADGVRPVNRPKGGSADPDNADPGAVVGSAAPSEPARPRDLGPLLAGDRRAPLDPTTPEGQQRILQLTGLAPRPWPEVEARLEELAEDQRAEREDRGWLRRPSW